MVQEGNFAQNEPVIWHNFHWNFKKSISKEKTYIEKFLGKFIEYHATYMYTLYILWTKSAYMYNFIVYHNIPQDNLTWNKIKQKNVKSLLGTRDSDSNSDVWDSGLGCKDLDSDLDSD